MKYPKSQLAILINVLQELSKYFDITSINPSNLHYIVYQQLSEGQQHNALYIKNNNVARFSKIESNPTGWTKLINLKTEFDLYPQNCNDANCVAAVKYALKKLQNNSK